jgi:pectate lyase
MKKTLFYFILMFTSFQFYAQTVNITQATPWLESAYLTWDPISGVDSYNVYYTGGGFTDQIIDTQLIRSYGTYFRADIIGLQAGSYIFKVAPVTAGVEGTATTSSSVTVLAHDRNGFAHSNGKIPGAYNLNGTLKSNAVVLYITEDTKNTISLNVTNANSNPCIGLQSILDGFKKGYDNRPLAIRLIGNITDLNYMLNGDLVIENNNNTNGSITFEGIGSDAVANGWGLRIKKGSNIEVRNLGYMLTNAAEGDNIGLQQDNNYVWVHNCDLFYGSSGGDADQAKGDGALDCKKSTYITFSYNHFWDSGKSCLLGLSENNTTGLYITYHHNWFDHSDSRHPRVRYFSAHIYNNYFDGNSKYGSGSTLGSSLFVEGNYFRNCKYPMLISKQGTDILNGAPGTFSGEDGGFIKAYDNYMVGQTSFLPYDASTNPIQFDAYEATTRNENISSSITSFQGGNSYNNFDTNTTLYVNGLVIDDPVTAKTNTMAHSGRVSGGDISFTFGDPGDDASSAVNAALMTLLTSYTTSLVYVQGITTIGGSTQTLTIPSNNDQIVVTGNAMVPMVFTWGGTATDVTVSDLPISGIDFVKDTANKTVTISGSPTADVSFTVTTVGSSGNPVSGTGAVAIGDGNFGDEIHNFTVSTLNSAFYTFTSANMNSTAGSATYDGLTLTARLKIESATIISYTTPAESTLTLVFDPTFNGTIKLDNISYTASSGLVTIPSISAGNHTITKGNTTNLYYIKTAYNPLSVSGFNKSEIVFYPNPVSNELTISVPNEVNIEGINIYDLTGRLIKESKGSATAINISDFVNGSYIVSVYSSEGIITKKIIKN